ncbi:hypothetical protein [Lapillicoccus sp.]
MLRGPRSPGITGDRYATHLTDPWCRALLADWTTVGTTDRLSHLDGT